MEIFVDDQPFECSNPTQTIADLITEVRDKLCEDDRLILGIRCNDGEFLDSDQYEQVCVKPSSDFDRIDLTTGSPKALVREALNQAIALFEETEPDQKEIVKLLAEGNSTRAMKLLGGCFKAWHQAHEAVIKSVGLLEIDIDGIRVGDKPLAESLGQLATQLRQVKDAIEAKDFVTLSDILQYEFAETTTHWTTMIRTLLQQTE